MTVIFDQDIRFGYQFSQDFLALLLLEIDRDPTLVAVHHHEGCRFFTHLWRNHSPCVISTRHLFNLDHIGPQICQHQPANGPRHDMRQLKNPDPLERTPL